ncbi:MAG: class I SAM-dependent methyltransferase [Raoultibacter sp.]
MSDNFHKKEEAHGYVGSQALESFAVYLRIAAAERSLWAREQGISCYRIYDAELSPFALSIDIYEGSATCAGKKYLVIGQYKEADAADETEEQQRFSEAVEIASQALGIAREYVFEKARDSGRNGFQYKDGERSSFIVQVSEGGHLFELDLKGYLDTGIFLDHRPTRAKIGQMAEGKHFLNLFAYTGTASVYAAAQGAASTTTVDLSQTYVNWAKRNMELNELAGEHRFIRSDALHWLDRDIRKGVTYNLVFADPPTFSRSKLKGKKTWSVARDHVELLQKIAAVLSNGGKAIFSCNLRDFKPDERELAKSGIRLEDITQASIPADFASNPKIHQCYLLSR